MKKTKFAILILFLFTLTSCLKPTFCKSIAYFYAIDDCWNVRYVQENKKDRFYVVDEYYYEGETDSDNIIINIEIPNEINGIPVTNLGGFCYKIGEKVYKDHDTGYRQSCWYLNFAIMTNSIIDENSYIEINIYVPENVRSIGTSSGFSIYNNSEYYDELYIRYDNFSVNYYIDENNSYLYSKDGTIYSKQDESEYPSGKVRVLKMHGNKLRKPD